MSRRSKAQAQLCLQMDPDRPVRQIEHILEIKSRSIEIEIEQNSIPICSIENSAPNSEPWPTIGR
jgi:hypothetical protein